MKKHTITISSEGIIDLSFDLMCHDVIDAQNQIISALIKPSKVYQCDWHQLDETDNISFTEISYRLYLAVPLAIKTLSKRKPSLARIYYVKIYYRKD